MVCADYVNYISIDSPKKKKLSIKRQTHCKVKNALQWVCFLMPGIMGRYLFLRREIPVLIRLYAEPVSIKLLESK